MLNNLVIPLTFFALPYIPLVIIFESVFTWIFIKYRLHKQVKMLKCFLVLLLANVLTSFIGTIIPIYKTTTEQVSMVGLAFVVSVFVEWIIMLPYLFPHGINRKQSLTLSLIINLISYILYLIVILLNQKVETL